jgi:HEAT repeat protein
MKMANNRKNNFDGEHLDDGFRIYKTGQDESLDWLDEGSAATRSDLSFQTLLDTLIEAKSPPSLPDLYALSDLTRGDAETLRARWPEIPVGVRLAVVEALADLADEEIDLALGALLRIALGDSDARIRAAALRGFFEDAEPDLAGPLVQLLQNDPSHDVRAAAATALGEFVLAGELDELDATVAMRAEQALLEIVHNEGEPVEVRRRALESIAFSSEAGIRQLIEEAYYSPDEEMRVSSLQAMARSADVRWRPLIRAELDSPSAEMRAEAAYACGELEAKSALYELLDLLTDDDARVRLNSIFALGRLGGRDARDALEIIVAGENEEEAEAAEQALEEMDFYASAGSVPLFDESLDEDDDDFGPMNRRKRDEWDLDE